VCDAEARSSALLTIKDSAEAAELPQPVVDQYVSRVWTRDGWMYTRAALREAVELAAQLRGDGGRPRLEVLDGSV
jgi:hypothetical protein